MRGVGLRDVGWRKFVCYCLWQFVCKSSMIISRVLDPLSLGVSKMKIRLRKPTLNSRCIFTNSLATAWRSLRLEMSSPRKTGFLMRVAKQWHMHQRSRFESCLVPCHLKIRDSSSARLCMPRSENAMGEKIRASSGCIKVTWNSDLQYICFMSHIPWRPLRSAAKFWWTLARLFFQCCTASRCRAFKVKMFSTFVFLLSSAVQKRHPGAAGIQNWDWNLFHCKIIWADFKHVQWSS